MAPKKRTVAFPRVWCSGLVVTTSSRSALTSRMINSELMTSHRGGPIWPEDGATGVQGW
jgi:hypothetical protein